MQFVQPSYSGMCFEPMASSLLLVSPLESPAYKWIRASIHLNQTSHIRHHDAGTGYIC